MIALAISIENCQPFSRIKHKRQILLCHSNFFSESNLHCRGQLQSQRRHGQNQVTTPKGCHVLLKNYNLVFDSNVLILVSTREGKRGIIIGSELVKIINVVTQVEGKVGRIVLFVIQFMCESNQ